MIHEHWSSYWQTGVTGSFGSQEPEWYTIIVKPYWKKLFDELPQNTGILDIATGNGAVAFIASETDTRENKNFTIVATDKSRQTLPDDDKISNGSRGQNSIRFLFDTPIEKLEFPDQTFDIITSQFGIEYSDTNKALTTLSKCLSPQADLVFIVHHKDSVISHQSRDELKQYRIIMDQYPLFQKLKSLLKSMGDIKSRKDIDILKTNKKAIQDREAFNRLISKLTTKYPQSIVIADLLNAIKPLFKDMMMMPVKQKLNFLDSIKLQRQQARQRLLDMVEAAFDDKKLQSFIKEAEKKGFECLTAEKLEDGSNHILAWEIRLKFR